jgi:hypothetical protein
MNRKKVCAAWTSDDPFAVQAANVCLGRLSPARGGSPGGSWNRRESNHIGRGGLHNVITQITS